MILQCDQCNTKFRLDDSKLKPGGVKVRCSKCRHVFLAGAEPQKQEDSDFDAILSGLGAPTPEKREEAAPAGQAPSEFNFDQEPAAVSPTTAGFGFAEESALTDEAPVAQRQAPAAAAQPDANDFAAFDFPADSFAAEPAKPQDKAASVPEDRQVFDDFDFAPEPAPKQEALATPASRELDFGDFAFAEEPAPLKEESATAPGDSFAFGDFEFNAEHAAKPQEAAPAPDDLDFGDFSFSEEPAVKDEVPPPAAKEEPDYGDFSFSEEPAVTDEAPPPAAQEAVDFGEFSFSEEPVAKDEEPPAAKEAFDFGEFSFSEEPAKKEEPPAAKEEAFDFGDFSFSEEPAVKNEEPPAVDKEAVDFGEFSFSEEPAAKSEEPPAAAGEAFDFGEFSFSEEPAVKNEEPPPAAKEPFDFGEFSFAEEPPPAKQAPAADAANDLGAIPSQDELPEKQGEAAGPGAGFDLGEFSFSRDLTPAQAEQAGAAGVSGAAHRADAATAAPRVSPALDTEKLLARDKSSADKLVATPFPEAAEEEELPPLSISSRRKGRSLLTVSIVTVCVLVVLALSGAGLYLLQSGPAALETFDKAGLGFVGKWFGMEIPEDGRITIKSLQAGFHQNKEAGEVFVVTGEAVNSFKKARASINVKVTLFDKNGKKLVEKTAYCGNNLSNEQLTTLPMAKVESIMNNQFGDSLANLGVKPGKAIGFAVAIANVPKEAADFGAEVVSSTVAGQ